MLNDALKAVVFLFSFPTAPGASRGEEVLSVLCECLQSHHLWRLAVGRATLGQPALGIEAARVACICQQVHSCAAAAARALPVVLPTWWVSRAHSMLSASRGDAAACRARSAAVPFCIQ